MEKGKPLLVEIIRKKSDTNVIAGLYYHWGGYSLDALKYLKELSDYFKDNNLYDKSDAEIQLSVIRFAESVGGGILNTDRDNIVGRFPNEKFIEFQDIKTGNGLVVLSFNVIESIENNVAGIATFAIEDRQVCPDMFYVYEDYDKYKAFCIKENNQEESDVYKDIEMEIIRGVDVKDYFSEDLLPDYIEKLDSVDIFMDDDGAIIELI